MGGGPPLEPRRCPIGIRAGIILVAVPSPFRVPIQGTVPEGHSAATLLMGSFPMSETNTINNRAVWFDIPVSDLDRAVAFYKAVLAIDVHKQDFDGLQFAVLDHGPGNGGCLVIKPDEVIGDKGLLLYLGVEGRIRDAEAKVAEHGGKVVESTHAIGPHGCRAIVLDSEGNRIVLHSQVDA